MGFNLTSAFVKTGLFTFIPHTELLFMVLNIIFLSNHVVETQRNEEERWNKSDLVKNRDGLKKKEKSTSRTPYKSSLETLKTGSNLL